MSAPFIWCYLNLVSSFHRFYIEFVYVCFFAAYLSVLTYFSSYFASFFSVYGYVHSRGCFFHVKARWEEQQAVAIFEPGKFACENGWVREMLWESVQERERERELLEPASSWRAFLGRYKLSKDLSRKWTHERILYFRKRIGRYFLKDEKYLFAIQLFDNHYLLWPQNCAGLSNAHTLHRQIICYSFPCDKQNC